MIYKHLSCFITWSKLKRANLEIYIIYIKTKFEHSPWILFRHCCFEFENNLKSSRCHVNVKTFEIHSKYILFFRVFIHSECSLDAFWFFLDALWMHFLKCIQTAAHYAVWMHCGSRLDTSSVWMLFGFIVDAVWIPKLLYGFRSVWHILT